MLAKATIIDAAEYKGPVSAQCRGEWGDGYSSDIGSMIEACHDFGEPVPAYCHPCTALPLKLDPESLLEQATDDMHEEASDQIVNADELVAFITAWNEKQTCVSYYEDRSRVIIIDQMQFDDIMDGAADPLST